MVGLERGTVRLVEHSPEWERLFEDEAERLRSTLDDRVIAIEHVGSTAVEGLIAKPVVDILLVVDEIGSAETWSSLLEDQSYTYRSTDSVPDRHFFAKGPPATRTCYLSITERGSDTHREQLLFRDHLRANPDAAAAYERLKRTLAAQFPDDRQSYTERKSRFVHRILEDARRE